MNKGFSQIIILIILVIGLVVGLVVVQNRTQLFPKADEPGLSCRTLGTFKIGDSSVIGGNDPSKYRIGCDIEVTSGNNLNLSQSYCVSQVTGQRENLKPDTFSRPNVYYATLHNLDKNEEVKVYATSDSGQTVECLPSLTSIGQDSTLAAKPSGVLKTDYSTFCSYIGQPEQTISLTWTNTDSVPYYKASLYKIGNNTKTSIDESPCLPGTTARFGFKGNYSKKWQYQGAVVAYQDSSCSTTVLNSSNVDIANLSTCQAAAIPACNTVATNTVCGQQAYGKCTPACVGTVAVYNCFAPENNSCIGQIRCDSENYKCADTSGASGD